MKKNSPEARKTENTTPVVPPTRRSVRSSIVSPFGLELRFHPRRHRRGGYFNIATNEYLAMQCHEIRYSLSATKYNHNWSVEWPSPLYGFFVTLPTPEIGGTIRSVEVDQSRGHFSR